MEAYSVRCCHPTHMKQAIIYCRVSSEKQATEGHGLTSQESSCRKFARENDFNVVKVFTDDSTGGGDFWRRPGITALLTFLDHRKGETAVIFDDLKRFARDTMFHLKLRQELSSRNAYPRCPNFRFDESPEGYFVETIIAATAELERKQNRRQVISRMKARLEGGHWVFSPPLGYRFEKVHGDRRVVIDPTFGQAVRSALVDFAVGKLPTQAAVHRYLNAHGCSSHFSKSPNLSKQAIHRLLTNEFYAGWCVCEKWKMRVRGVHEPLISATQYQAILRRLEPLPNLRKDVRKEFPLRGFVQCAHCARSLTAGWSHGRNARYPYYRCQTKRCIGSTLKDDLEDLFLGSLRDARPLESAVALFERVLLDAGENRHLLQKQRVTGNRKRVKEIAAEMDNFLDVIGRSTDVSIQQIYEQKLVSLRAEKEVLESSDPDEVILDFEPVFEQGRQFLRDPMGSWKDGNLKRRQAVQHLVFEAPIQYDPDRRLCTAEYSLLYRLLGASGGGESSLVESIRKNLHPVAEELDRWGKILNTLEI